MATQVIVVNGGSSAGKSAIVRCLQAVLPDPWLSTGVDVLIEALPPSLSGGGSGGLRLGANGEVGTGEGFRAVENAWTSGFAAMARAGARVIIDDVFLDGAVSQERTRALLDGLEVLWVGVHCDAAVAAGRETARGDRVAGMAASQAQAVHRGVVYDVEVDTTRTEAITCAHAIADHVVRAT